MSPSIVTLRQELAASLGPNYTRYLSVMRDWFGNRHNRADWEFDMPFLAGRSGELHNALIRSILSLCMSPDFENQRANLEYFAPTITNVITLHSASAQVQVQQTITNNTPMEMDVDIEINGPKSVSASTPAPEGDAEDEQEESEEAKLKQMFTIITKKVQPDEIEESGNSSLSKIDRRLPTSFTKDFIGINDEFFSVVPNVTHYLDIDEPLRSDPDQGKYFRSRGSENDPWLTTDATIPGKILLRARARGIKSIDPNAVKLLSKATREHLKDVIRELIKRRKSFQLNSGHLKFGEPHPNPYLLTPHVPDTTLHKKMPRPWMLLEHEPHTVPPRNGEMDIKEQETVQLAAASLDKESRFRSKIGLTELYELVKSKPLLFPYRRLRVQLLEKCLQKAKGFFESLDEDEIQPNEDEGEPSEFLPLCTY